MKTNLTADFYFLYRWTCRLKPGFLWKEKQFLCAILILFESKYVADNLLKAQSAMELLKEGWKKGWEERTSKLINLSYEIVFYKQCTFSKSLIQRKMQCFMFVIAKVIPSVLTSKSMQAMETENQPPPQLWRSHWFLSIGPIIFVNVNNFGAESVQMGNAKF